ncbi:MULTISPECIES: iron uptake porin [Synechococcales]|uniref:iron uptake porin n=1 Tax=Synechococcus sp. CS-1333 TaxID=2848638 RepID=UPI0021E2E0B2|nr:iron uptake porin [Synechococcus sp. CS-1333]MCT0210978.1 iron uptake porin [Synechococcus sp. CS-1333]
MNRIQHLLLAPAALGLLAPVAASASELNMDGVNRYANVKEQVTSINQFSDVQPTEWAYQALSNLIERYGCVAGYPDGTFRGKQALSRWEAAALLNACLDRITEVTDELRRLLKEFEAELAVLKGRVDGLEAKVGELEATQFSTTTKLQGQATFVLGAVNAGGNSTSGRFRTSSITSGNDSENYNARFGATTFNYDVRLNFITSFTGKDQLYTRLRSGNFNNAFNGNGVNLTALDIASNGFGQTSCTGNRNCSDVVGIDRLWYRFPVGRDVAITVGPKARNTEMLAVTPSVYGKGDKILDLFTLHGAPGVYNKATGAAAGITWRQNVPKGKGRFSAGASYVAQQGDSGTSFDGNPFSCSSDEGGIGTDCARGNFLAQLNYTTPQWNISAAYRYGQAATNFRRGTNFAASNSWFLANGDSNSVAVNAYWQPKKSGFIPSISIGWGLNSLSGNETQASGVEFASPFVSESQSWFVGLEWSDVFAKGNAAGMAVGQPVFATQLKSGTTKGLETTPNDGNYVWEWWYKFQVTDNISVTPAIFYLSRPLGQQTGADQTFNVFGGLVQTTFRF